RAVRPTEAYDVLLVASGNVRFGGARGHVVFFADGAVAAEILRNRGQELVGRAIRVRVIPIAPQTLDSKQLGGRPAVGIVPLHGVIAITHRQTTRSFEHLQVVSHGLGLFLGRDPSP